MQWFVPVIGIGVIAGIILLSWPRQGMMGIRWGRNTCPRCGAKQPLIRRPQNERQMLFGGGTCACGCEMDKYGKEIT